MTEEPLYPLLRLERHRMGTDGIGIRTLIAGAGCPLKCRWCINKRLLEEAPAKPVTAEDLIQRAALDDLYFQATGGGVTFGGGESLLHAAFLLRFRELCPPGWHICAETSLAVPPEQVQMAMEAVDEFIVDCKDLDPVVYENYTGGDESLMESNLRMLLENISPERILVRVPHIPEYNSECAPVKNAEILQSMGVSRLELFDYVIRDTL